MSLTQLTACTGTRLSPDEEDDDDDDDDEEVADVNLSNSASGISTIVNDGSLVVALKCV